MKKGEKAVAALNTSTCYKQCKHGKLTDKNMVLCQLTGKEKCYGQRIMCGDFEKEENKKV